MKENQQPDRDQTAAEAQNEKKATTRGIVRLVVSLAICLCTVGAIFATAIQGSDAQPASQPSSSSSQPSSSTQQPSSSETTPSTQNLTNAPKSVKEGMYNLLLGSIDKENHMDLTVINLNTATHQLNMLSFPRDTLVYTSEEIPTVFEIYSQAEKREKGTGLEAVLDMLKSTFGFPMDGYLLVSDQQLEGLLSVTGEIAFEVPKEFDGYDTDLRPGRQLLDAAETRILLRHSEFEDTFTGSAELHGQFALALLKQLQSAAMDEVGAKALAEKLTAAVQTKLTAAELQYLLQALAECDLSQTTPIVPNGEVITPEETSYYQLSVDGMLTTINRSFSPYDKELTQYDVYIRNENELPTNDYEPYHSSSSGNSGYYEPDPEPTYYEPDPEPTDYEPDPEPTEEETDPTDETEPTGETEPTEEIEPTEPESSENTDPTEPEPTDLTEPETSSVPEPAPEPTDPEA